MPVAPGFYVPDNKFLFCQNFKKVVPLGLLKILTPANKFAHISLQIWPVDSWIGSGGVQMLHR